jgi:transcriptional/translational regulatory protein YebC/TACO1
VTTSKDTFTDVDAALREKWYNITSSDLSYEPENTIELNANDTSTLNKILAALEDDDDVDSVYTNLA